MKNPITQLVRYYRLKARRTNYIFLLSHMRGYTSLLSHIIGSNPDIKGYTEMHQSYRSTLGLLKLRYKSKLTTQENKVPSYLFDKILHNKYGVTKKIVNQRNVYPIIMVREPEATMKSIINMGEKYTKVVAWYRDPEKVLDYYIKRLKRLEKIGKRANGKALFINAQNVVDNPDRVLEKLSEFLKLDTPLSKEYDTFSLTGAKGAGDPSKNIKSGTIVKKRDQYESIVIDEGILKQAREAYEETVAFLKQHCKTVE